MTAENKDDFKGRGTSTRSNRYFEVQYTTGAGLVT